jgi:hypothetical protein
VPKSGNVDKCLGKENTLNGLLYYKYEFFNSKSLGSGGLYGNFLKSINSRTRKTSYVLESKITNYYNMSYKNHYNIFENSLSTKILSFCKPKLLKITSTDSIFEKNTTSKHKIKKLYSKNLNLITLMFFLQNPILFKQYLILSTSKRNVPLLQGSKLTLSNTPLKSFFSKNPFLVKSPILISNLSPNKHFNLTFFKKVYTSINYQKLKINFIPIYYNTIIRFVEHISGKKVLLQFYPFVNQSITQDWLIRYKLWLPRLTFYEKKLGHKFFLEESLHIIHSSLYLKDSKLLIT